VTVRTTAIFAVATVMIAMGFWSLSRGSLTLAPVLLVAGYCVAIPVAIMAGGKGTDDRSEGSDE
jgi:hypothetical protein